MGEATKKHYAAHGMAVQQVEAGRKKISFSINSNSLYENTDAFEPEREKQATLMGYDEKLDSTGLLLLPPKSRAKLDKPNPNLQLSVVGSRLSAAPPDVSPDGLRSVLVYSCKLSSARRGCGSRLIPPGFLFTSFLLQVNVLFRPQ